MKNNNDYLNTLKNISNILKTQSYDGNTEKLPTYWMVQKKDRIWVVNEDIADGYWCAWEGEEPVDFKTFKDMFVERLESLQDDVLNLYIDSVKKATAVEELEEICEKLNFIFSFTKPYHWGIDIYYYQEEWKDIPNELFLTKQDALNYIKNFDYRYKSYEKPLRTYAYIAENSPDLTALVDALKNINWNMITNAEPEPTTDLYVFKGESIGKIENGKSYGLIIRYNPVHSDYPTAWVKNEEGKCIAVLPYVKEEWYK